MMYQHILLATDLMTEHQALITKAASLAKEWNAKLTLLHIVEPLPSYGYAYVGSADVENRLIEEAREELKKLGEQLSIGPDDQIVDIGPTKAEIIRIAEEKKVDLIVIGSHGRHGLGAVLGSTANAVLHHASCDVLTIRVG
jgi:universal stress protein A